jgi:hypothetical protein
MNKQKNSLIVLVPVADVQKPTGTGQQLAGSDHLLTAILH